MSAVLRRNRRGLARNVRRDGTVRTSRATATMSRKVACNTMPTREPQRLFERSDMSRRPPSASMTPAATIGADTEWLEADGLGGFASGPVRGPRTRRYHALLLTATTPPTGRVVLINGFEAYVEFEAVATPLGVHRYLPDVLFPSGSEHLLGFASFPGPPGPFGSRTIWSSGKKYSSRARPAKRCCVGPFPTVRPAADFRCVR